MKLGIEGKIALVTGDDSGIGLATTRRLLAEGATVIMTDRDERALTTAAQSSDWPGDTVYCRTADVTRPDDIEALEQYVRDEVGQIDILVNCAGIHGAVGNFDTIDDAGWQQVLDVNLMGSVRVTRAFLPHMRSKGWGRIVFIASEDAVQTYPDEIPYCASKAGILALSKGISETYAEEGVLANCVSPAFIATPMTDEMMKEQAKQQGVSFDEAIAKFLAEQRPGIELKRRGDPDEVANVIAFLCSERASFVNGANWRVDGGSVQVMI